MCVRVRVGVLQTWGRSSEWLLRGQSAKALDALRKKAHEAWDGKAQATLPSNGKTVKVGGSMLLLRKGGAGVEGYVYEGTGAPVTGVEMSTRLGKAAVGMLMAMDAFRSLPRWLDYLRGMPVPSVRLLQDHLHAGGAEELIDVVQLISTSLGGTSAADARARGLPRYRLPASVLRFRPAGLSDESVAEVAAEFKRLDELVLRSLVALSSDETRALRALTAHLEGSGAEPLTRSSTECMRM